MSLYLVFLRRPKNNTDRRNDPFWEFGSFGRTGCHGTNLLNPQRTPITKGDRLGFIQGGKGELRIVGLTPPVEVSGVCGKIEVKWDCGYRPIPFEQAPILIDNNSNTDFPSLKEFLAGVNRTTLCGAAASRLRARKLPLDPCIANEIETYFQNETLPEAMEYQQAIVPQGHKWSLVVNERNWASPNERRSEYRRLGGCSQ